MVKKIWKPTETQIAVMNVLAKAEKPLTLEEISKAVGFEVKSGSITVLIKNGFIGHGEDAIKQVVVNRHVKTYTAEKGLPTA